MNIFVEYILPFTSVVTTYFAFSVVSYHIYKLARFREGKRLDLKCIKPSRYPAWSFQAKNTCNIFLAGFQTRDADICVHCKTRVVVRWISVVCPAYYFLYPFKVLAVKQYKYLKKKKKTFDRKWGKFIYEYKTRPKLKETNYPCAGCRTSSYEGPLKDWRDCNCEQSKPIREDLVA